MLQVLAGLRSEEEFLAGERELREALGYPPFGRLARLRFESQRKEDALAQAQETADRIAELGLSERLDVLGPSEAFLERAKDVYRYDLLLKAKEIRPLQQAVFAARDLAQRTKRSIWVDVDPYGAG